MLDVPHLLYQLPLLRFIVLRYLRLSAWHLLSL